MPDNRQNPSGRRAEDSVIPFRGIHTEHEKRVEDAMKNLVEKHVRKEVIGLAYIAICRGGKHLIRVSGMATECPDVTNGLAVRMISDLLHSERD